jgi:hypothetical protein
MKYTRWVSLSCTQVVSLSRALYRAERLLDLALFSDWRAIHLYHHQVCQGDESELVAALDAIVPGSERHEHAVDHSASERFAIHLSVVTMAIRGLFARWYLRWRFLKAEIRLFGRELARASALLTPDSKPAVTPNWLRIPGISIVIWPS